MGAVHKVRHARGGSEKVWQSVTRRGGPEGRGGVMSHFSNFFIHMIHMKPKIEGVVTDVFWQKGGWTKTTPNKTFQTKKPDKTPRQELPRTKTNLSVRRMHVLLKIGGFRDVWHTLGVPGCVTMCDRGGGQNFSKNSMTYFMDGPMSLYLSYKFKWQMPPAPQMAFLLLK